MRQSHRMGVNSVEVGDEVGDGGHARISHLQEVMGRGDVARFRRDSGKGVESEDLDMGIVGPAGSVEDRLETFLGARDPIRTV